MWINYQGKDDNQLGSEPSSQAHGHDLDLNISFNPETSQVVCHVQASTKSGHKAQPVLVEEPASQIREISITTTGGKGAPGNHGADGMPGTNGIDGRDASQYSPGTDGSDGGRGADGKPGSSGGGGGDGGNVNIRISDADTDLLPLLRVHNFGGEGGVPGTHGQGGRGGMPGKGGRPYSWTTSHKVAVQKSKWEDYRAYEPNNPAAIGGMVNRSHLVYYTDYETQYRQHHQPGGRDGYQGGTGATPATPLLPGRPGRGGELSIHVYSHAGAQSYRGPFDVALMSFRAAAALDNGVYEPGESVEISDITIRNRGAMPTPDGSRIRIFLRQGDWMVCDPQELYLLETIAPGQTVTIKGTMKFRIKEYESHHKEAYEEAQLIDLGAATSRFGAQFPGFTKGQKIVVSHPIVVSKVSAPTSLLPGKIGKISFQIRNTSKKPIGSAAVDIELQREMKLTLAIESDRNGPGALFFCDSKGSALKGTSLERSISSIGPGKTATVSCHVKLSQSHQNHNRHKISANLLLEKIGNAAALKRIQTEEIEIKEGIGYTPQVDDDLLLVTNVTTSPEELRAWGDVARALGLSFSIWDISVHGHLDVSAPGPQGSLLDRWKGKTIVMLNQRTEKDVEHEAAPSDLLSIADLDRALRLSNTKVYVVGDVETIRRWPPIYPSENAKRTEAFKDINSFIGSLRRELPATTTNCTIRVERYTHPFSIPPRKFFDNEAQNLKKLLEERFPNERFLVHPHYSLTTTTRYPLTGVQYDSLGEIVVRRVATANEGIYLGTSIDEPSVHSKRFVGSKLNIVSLIAAMPHKQCAHVLVRFLRNQVPSKDALAAMCGGLLKKIMHEANMAEANYKAQTPSGIPVLDTLLEVFQAELGPAGGRLNVSSCAEMIGHLEYYSARRLHWKQAFLVLGTPFKVSEIFDARIGKIEKQFKQSFSKPEYDRYWQAKKAVLSSLRKEFAESSREEFESLVTKGAPAEQLAGVFSWTINPYLGKWWYS